MIRILFCCAALIAAAQVPAQEAGDRIIIKDGRESALPIAIVPFAWEAAAMPDGTDVAQVIATDLDRTGEFRTMARQDLPQMPARGSEINFQRWSVFKQDYIVVGRIQQAEVGFRVEFELHDLKNQKSELAFSLPVRPGGFRGVAHQISDMVYEKITRKRGAFSTRIAYITNKRQANGEFEYAVWVADYDGFNAQWITKDNDPYLSPAWSPDGKKLAYVSFERKEGPAIYLHDLATTQRQVITAFKGINGAPAFSPDGSSLVVTLSRSGNPEIYTLNLASKSLTQLTRHFSIDTEAAWTPGGESLLFTSDRAGKPQIYSMPASGGSPTRVTSVGEYNAGVDVSYDGNLLAMVQGNKNVYRIAVLDRQRGGSGTVRLISPGPLDESPSFAPNASMVLYAAREGNRGVLYSAATNGTVRSRLAIADGNIREPAWGPFRQR